MAKKSVIARNQHRIKTVQKFEKRRIALKQAIKDKSKDIEEHFALQLQLQKLPRNSSKVRVRNRCALTGRGRGVYRKFQLSRIVFRSLANQGKLPGVAKSSW